MGITDFVNSKACGKPVHEVIREMTDGGVDYSFECTGILDVLRESFVSTHDVCIRLAPSVLFQKLNSINC
jgi:alcohol dehydrogenase